VFVDVLDDDDHGFISALLLLLKRDPFVGFVISDLLLCDWTGGGALIAHGSTIGGDFMDDNGGKKSSLSESLTGLWLCESEAHGSLVKPPVASPKSTSYEKETTY